MPYGLQVPILIFSRVNILHGARQQFAPRWGGRAAGKSQGVVVSPVSRR